MWVDGLAGLFAPESQKEVVDLNNELHLSDRSNGWWLNTQNNCVILGVKQKASQPDVASVKDHQASHKCILISPP